MDIQFNRYARECPHNTVPGNRKIYDFSVIIDGVPRAIFWRASTPKDWLLRDTGHQFIRSEPNSTIRAYSEKSFKSIIEDYIAHIPTEADLAKRREGYALQAAADAQKRKVRERRNRIQEKAEEMYSILLDYAAHLPPAAAQRCSSIEQYVENPSDNT